jgi:hypothetical protein
MAEELENPFEIKDDMELIGERTSQLASITALLQQLVKLEPGDKKQSISIPKTICENKNKATGLVAALRRAIEESEDPETNKISFTTRAVMGINDNKEYLGTRIWRTT